MPSIDFRLYLVTDRHQTQGRPLLSVLARFIDAGGTAIQVRERDLDTGQLMALLQDVQCLARSARMTVFINDRVDLATAMNTDGVHLRETSLPVPAVRDIVGSSHLIGVSAHSIDGVVQAECQGADFVVLGPIYETPSKRGYGQPLGLAMLERACHRVNIPVFAIGGISIARAREVRSAGAFGVAVISAILAAADVAVATHEMLNAVAEPTTH